MRTLDAKREADKLAAEAENTSETEDDTPSYYEDENGEVVIYDE